MEITKEQLSMIIADAISLGVHYENTSFEPDNHYEELMEELLGENWNKIDNVYDYESTMDYFLYIHTEIITEEFAEFIENCKKDLAVSE